MSGVQTRVIEYVTIDGDRWDNLAWRFYGNALDYERIIVANPAVPIYPVLPGGIKLLIPVIPPVEVDTTEGLPPWK